MLLSIGIDLDNTIIDYHNLFQTTLEQKTKTKLNRIFSKSNIKEIAKRDYGENFWADIQAKVYGKEIKKAKLMKGFDEFLLYARNKKFKLYIVSHKTNLSQNKEKNYKLIEAANLWLKTNNFFTLKAFEQLKSTTVKKIIFKTEDKIKELNEIEFFETQKKVTKEILHTLQNIENESLPELDYCVRQLFLKK